MGWYLSDTTPFKHRKLLLFAKEHNWKYQKYYLLLLELYGFNIVHKN